jgi:hypothetical protein
MSETNHYEWRRFWRPEGHSVSCEGDGDGFLLDPGQKEILSYDPKVQTIQDLITKHPVLVLCGTPGSGKTTELNLVETASAQGGDFVVISRKASAFGPSTPIADLSTRCDAWKNAKKEGKVILFLVDGLDEALQKEQTILSSLVELLKTETNLRQVRLILTCRSAHWLPETGQGLARLWGEEGNDIVYELCPLRRADAALAAGQRLGDQSEVFLNELTRCDAVPLARWPITLEMLITEFSKSKRLPQSRKELFQSAVQRLVEEPNSQRERHLQSTEPEWLPGEKLHLVRRIAAMTIFAGKKALVRTNDYSDPDSLTYADVLGDDGMMDFPSGQSHTITRNKIDRIAETRLFETVILGDGVSDSARAVRFSHRTFAELLAGEFVATLSADTLRRLFFVLQDGDEELIAPQLLQTAAWLVGNSENTDFFEVVLDRHPEALLHADLSPFAETQKRRLVETLLKKASDGDPGPERALSKASISIQFSGIEDLLRPIILDESCHTHGRRFAIDLARTCQVSELSATLWEILDRPDDPMRIEAGRTLGKIEPDPASRQKELEKIASGDPGDDDFETLKGNALRMLVPDCLPVRGVLDWLHAPRDQWHSGAYDSFLRLNLPRAISENDLVPCLRFLKNKSGCFDSLSYLYEFANRVFELACGNLNEVEVADALIELCLEKSRTFDPLPIQDNQSKSRSKKNGLSDRSNRHQFYKALFNHSETTGDDIRRLLFDLTHEDLEAFLSEIANAPPERRDTWAIAIRNAARCEGREQHRELLQLRFHEFAEVRDILPPVRKPGADIHETLLRFEKAGELILKRRRERNQRRFQEITNKNTTWKDVFERGLDQCRNGEARGWITVSHGLIGKADSIDLVEFDPEESELFQTLQSNDRQILRSSARKFLFEFRDDREASNNRTNWSESAYWAISWLREEIRNDSELRHELESKWIGSIIDAFNNGEPEHQELVALAYELDSDETRRWLQIQLDRKLVDEADGWLLDLRAFESIWDRQLSKQLANFLRSPEIKVRSFREGVLHLLQFDPEFAEEFLRNWINQIKQHDPELENGISRAAAAVSFFFATQVQQGEVWPLIGGNIESAKKLLLENLPDFDRNEKRSLERLASHLATNLLILVSQLFPSSEDPRLNESSCVTPTDECISLRRDLLHLITNRGETREVQRFLDSIPADEVDRYRWNLTVAKQNRALLEWHPCQPNEVVRLVDISNGSLIRDGNDLLEVALASLARFQADLQSHTLYRVWDGDQPKREQYISKEIERWLKDDLGRVAVDREVEVNRLNQRIDIKIQAFPAGSERRNPVTLVIEVKLADNKEIPDSIQTQLIGKYLSRNDGWNHGIFLVAWFYTKGKWEKTQYLKSKTPKAATKELLRYCQTAEKKTDFRFKVAPFLLDCSDKARPKSKSKVSEKGDSSRGWET